ncbi:lantibiotic dehydratase [Prauserella halophila]|uniref:Lantibiotic dehydratase n=1 Tax=Prauserella halophila TaxID=185641 RepID=A0ABN1W4Y2_9PSEU|nr:lantibiotic dehydratase [Prauserella halophila]MCP2236457.1 thiopeptide-type bacteriocin biosynthesis domain-containing protein [Prauserella halophila]
MTDRSSAEGLFRAWDFYLWRAPVGADRPGLHGDVPCVRDTGAHHEIVKRASGDARLMEAITVASPSLAEFVRRIAAEGTDTAKPSRLRRAAFAVLRYDLRMRSRPTPFGLFAGIACGDFATAPDPTELPYVAVPAAPTTRTQVDMQWLLAALRPVEERAGDLPGLRVQAHPAARVRGDRLVLDCASTFGQAPSSTSRASVSVRYTEPVRRALELAERPVALGVLTEALTERFGAAVLPRVRGLLDSLVAQEILLTELRPPLDGDDPLAHVMRVLDGAAISLPEQPAALLDALRGLEARIATYDRASAGTGVAELAEAASAAREVSEHPTPLHVDTCLTAGTVLPRAVAEEVERGVELMWRMSTPKLGLYSLRDYHLRFLERYGTDRLVPLLDLIDGDTGLGPPPGYSWPNSEMPEDTAEAEPDRDRSRTLHLLLATALRESKREVELDDDTVNALCRGAPTVADLPNSCEVTVHVTGVSSRAVAEGEFLVTLSPSPGSHQAGSTFTRFARALGGYQDRLVGAATAVPTHVVGARRADIAFLPRSGKAANLAHTAPSTGTRIGVGLFPSPHADEVTLSDIAVAATLERLCAVHVPSGREVTPILANMVSTTAQAPNAARLLWEIGLEGQRLWEPWKWGTLADSPFVPRVRYGRFVLAPAVWRLDELRDSLDSPEWTTAVAVWRDRWTVPRRVLAVSNDQRVELDLDEPWHVELLREELRKAPGLVAHEIPGSAHVDDGDVPVGSSAEFVVPLQRREAVPRRSVTPAHREERAAVHGLGGRWLYLKLYGTASGQNELLRTRLGELVDTARARGAERWFFLRYTDPDGHHLRLRLTADTAVLWQDIVPALGPVLERWQHEGLLRTHRVDEYDPEFERYGGAELAPWVEELFHADSMAAVDLLTLAADPECPYDIDTMAAMSVSFLAHTFGTPAVPHSGDDVGRVQDPAEVWMSRTGTRRELPERFRRDPAYWAELIDPLGGSPRLRGDVFGDKILAALRGRDEAVAVTRRAMDVFRADGACRSDEGRFVGSLMHMTCNRLLGGDSERERDVVALARGCVQDAARRRRHRG